MNTMTIVRQLGSVARHGLALAATGFALTASAQQAAPATQAPASLDPLSLAAAPAGARVIDGRGKWITPGIIDAHSHSANEAINEGSQSITAEVRMEDVLREDGISLYRQLAGGTTTVNILHGSANTVGGQNAVIKLRFGLPADSIKFA